MPPENYISDLISDKILFAFFANELDVEGLALDFTVTYGFIKIVEALCMLKCTFRVFKVLENLFKIK